MASSLQQRASDSAFVLCRDFSDRMTTDQQIRMEVASLVPPERLDVARCGDAVATFAVAVKVRI